MTSRRQLSILALATATGLLMACIETDVPRAGVPAPGTWSQSPGSLDDALWLGVDVDLSYYVSEPTPAPDSPAVDVFKPVVLFYQGATDVENPDVVTNQGFQLVVGGRAEDLQRLEHVCVRLPGDYGERDLRPSAEITGAPGPSAFWGYYGTAEGLPPAGSYEFELVLEDGSTLTLSRQHDGHLVDIPRGVDVTRVDTAMTIAWSPVDGARNYSVAVYESSPQGGTIFDTGLGCESGDPSAAAGAALELPAPDCVVADDSSSLVAGRWYVLSVAAWGYEQPEGIASFSGNHSAPFQW